MYFNAGIRWIAGGSPVILGPVYMIAFFVVMVNAIFSFRRIRNESSALAILHLNIVNYFTRSHPSNGEIFPNSSRFEIPGVHDFHSNEHFSSTQWEISGKTVKRATR